MTLPPRPELPIAFTTTEGDVHKLLKAYGQQCREAALYQAAEVCDNHAFGWEKNPGNNPLAGFIAASNCAGAVRNLK